MLSTILLYRLILPSNSASKALRLAQSARLSTIERPQPIEFMWRPFLRDKTSARLL